MDLLVIFYIILINIYNVFGNSECKSFVDITDGIHSGTNIIIDNLTFTENDYIETNGVIIGCICNILKCARKCCLDGEMMNFTSKSCEPTTQSIFHNFSYRNIIVIPDNTVCKEVQTKVIIEKDFNVLDEGVLVWENVEFAVDDYCLTYNVDHYVAIACVLEEQTFGNTLTSLGMIISMPFLLITFVVYLLLPERNVHRRALMSYVFTLLAAYVTLVTIQLYTGQFPDVPCHVLGHLIIFFFLVSFFWMNVMCIDMWLAFSGMRAFLGKQDAEKKRFIFYCIYAWGMPTVHTLMVFLINQYGDPNSGYHPEIGKRRCFLGEELPTFYYFYLPMAILIGINIILFILTTIRIQQIKKETSMLKHSDSNRHSYEDDKQKFNLYLKLMFAMGVNWIMELVSWLVDWVVKDTPTFVWYLTDFTNAMYGVLIFLIFVFKKKIWRSLKKRYYVLMGKPHLAHSMTTSSARGTRTSNYSTTETGVSSDYRLHDIRNGKPEETALTRP